MDDTLIVKTPFGTDYLTGEAKDRFIEAWRKATLEGMAEREAREAQLLQPWTDEKVVQVANNLTAKQCELLIAFSQSQPGYRTTARSTRWGKLADCHWRDLYDDPETPFLFMSGKTYGSLCRKGLCRCNELTDNGRMVLEWLQG